MSRQACLPSFDIQAGGFPIFLSAALTYGWQHGWMYRHFGQRCLLPSCTRSAPSQAGQESLLPPPAARAGAGSLAAVARSALATEVLRQVWVSDSGCDKVNSLLWIMVSDGAHLPALAWLVVHAWLWAAVLHVAGTERVAPYRGAASSLPPLAAITSGVGGRARVPVLGTRLVVRAERHGAVPAWHFRHGSPHTGS